MSCPHQSCSGRCDICTNTEITETLRVIAVCSTWAQFVRAGGDPTLPVVCVDEECPLHPVVIQ